MVQVQKSTVGLAKKLTARGYFIHNPLGALEYVLASLYAINPTYKLGTTMGTGGVGITLSASDQTDLVKLKSGLGSVLNGAVSIAAFRESYSAANNIASVAASFINVRDLTAEILKQGSTGIGLQLKIALDEIQAGASLNSITLKGIARRLKSSSSNALIQPETILSSEKKSVNQSSVDDGDTYMASRAISDGSEITIDAIKGMLTYYLGLSGAAPGTSSAFFRLNETFRTLALIQDFESGKFISAATSLRADIPLPSVDVVNAQTLTEFLQSNVAYAGTVCGYSFDLLFYFLKQITEQVISSAEFNKFYLVEQEELRRKLEALDSYSVVNSWPLHKVFAAIGEASSITMTSPLHEVSMTGTYPDIFNVMKQSYGSYSTIRKAASDGTPVVIDDALSAAGPTPKRSNLELLYTQLLDIYYMLEPFCRGPVSLKKIGEKRDGVSVVRKSINTKLLADTSDDLLIGKGLFFRGIESNDPFGMMNKLALSENILLKTFRNPTLIGGGLQGEAIANSLYVEHNKDFISEDVYISIPTTRSLDDTLLQAMSTRLLRIRPSNSLELMEPHTGMFILQDQAGFASMLGISTERVLDVLNNPTSRRLFTRAEDPENPQDLFVRLKSSAPLFLVNDSYAEESKGVFIKVPSLSRMVGDFMCFDDSTMTLITDGSGNHYLDPHTRSAIITNLPGFNTTLLTAAEVRTIQWGAYFADNYGAQADVMISSAYFQ